MPEIKLTPEQAEKINLRNPAALAAAMQGRLDDAIAASTPGGIIAQEAAGQAMLVANGALLPKRAGIHNPPTREQITAATGIVFGEDHDDLFVKVTLPEGWKIEPTDHNMWTKLVDANGCERAGIFYKAAFYDRSAHMDFTPRYTVMCDYAKPVSTVGVRDGKTGQWVFTAGTVANNESMTDRGDLLKNYEERNKLEKLATEWVTKNHENFRDAFAYWND